ncbi:YgfZ/GcvT domain-containing protein [Thauera linaloolentis]|uniref:Folate-binding protein YgfZ n=1 Tax=Thauera linaloolentis (strain DSM 12138 / JCM 21573 / CCUG 41526 / CIP 105981 / IAM 15112 / NBRC 102519 / 47Lol) TaxID=1123367 RepID=N6ZBK0_THAL4|nr:folate-binding protein YgfZ [Thauera linaloolentis]ENO89579.1 folate-binding protein YgfZ [Thauera linaloolentis 47Lol = DSM 12138]MCM8565897.1 folate-binding protein YgfZ [Thauera linaloolentis]
MTAWTDFLARQGATLTDNGIHFAASADEARAATDSTVVVPLLHLGTVRSVGPDSAAFIHNLVSNDVQNLAADGAAWNSFNSAKGRMIASFLIWPEANGHALALSADILPAFLKKFSMYVLRSKVKLANASEDLVLLGIGGADAAAVLAEAGLPVPGAPMKQAGGGDAPRCIRLDERNFVVAAAADAAPALFDALQAAGAIKAGTGAWQLAMIRAGIPLVTQPTQEEFVAQMLNYELIGGVSFKKGCYPGQEIVARSQYLGKLKKRMYRVAASPDAALPPAGADLYAPAFGEQSAGKIVNAAPTADGGFEALAVLQNSSAEAGEIHLGSVDGPRLALRDLPYGLG